jgi:hypothetical protein
VPSTAFDGHYKFGKPIVSTMCNKLINIIDLF